MCAFIKRLARLLVEYSVEHGTREQPTIYSTNPIVATVSMIFVPHPLFRLRIFIDWSMVL